MLLIATVIAWALEIAAALALWVSASCIVRVSTIYDEASAITLLAKGGHTS